MWSLSPRGCGRWRDLAGGLPRRGGLAAAIVLVAAVVAGCLADNRAGDFAGRGTVQENLSCLGVKLETGGASGRFYSVAFWPQGYTVKRVVGASPTLVDAGGATVLREGDTIDVRLHVVIATGDTPCGNTAVATVVDFMPVPSPSR